MNNPDEFKGFGEFGDFGSFDTGGEASGTAKPETKEPAPPKEHIQQHMANILAESNDDKSKSVYDSYRKAADSYKSTLEALHKSRADSDKAKKEREYADAEHKQADKDYTEKVRELESKLNEVSKMKAAVEKELNTVRDGKEDDSRLPSFDRNWEVIECIRNIVSNRLATPAQMQFLTQPAEAVCGVGKAIGTPGNVNALESSFAETELCSQLLNPVPDENVIKGFSIRLAAIIAAVFLVVALLSGSEFPLMVAIIKGACYLAVWLISGTLASFFIYSLLTKKQFFSDKVSLVLSGLVGFFVIGSAVASWLSGSLSKFFQSGGFVSRLLVGIILGAVLLAGFYFFLQLGIMRRLIARIPRLKRHSVRSLLKLNENGKNVTEALYCFANHDDVAAFFRENHRAELIKQLQKGIEDADFIINSYNEDMADVKETHKREQADAEKKRTELDNKIRMKDSEIKRSEGTVGNCIRDIRIWEEDKHQPSLRWFDEYKLGSSLCFTGTADENGISVRGPGDKGLVVQYSYNHMNNEIEAACEACERVIRAFQAMNPAELMDIWVINLSDGSSAMQRDKTIDWWSESADASGGVGKTSRGTVHLVPTITALEKFFETMENKNNARNQYEISHGDLIKEKMNGERFTRLQHVNACIKEEAGSGVGEPYRYQIFLIVFNYRDSCNYNQKLIDTIMGGLGDSYIPVYMLNMNLPQADNTLYGESWKKLVRDADANKVFLSDRS